LLESPRLLQYQAYKWFTMWRRNTVKQSFMSGSAWLYILIFKVALLRFLHGPCAKLHCPQWYFCYPTLLILVPMKSMYATSIGDE